MFGIIKKNECAVLVDMGEMGFWIVTRVNNKRIRLFAGSDRNDALSNYRHYATKEA